MLTQQERENLLYIAGVMSKMFPGASYVAERTVSMPTNLRYQVVENRGMQNDNYTVYVSKDRRQWTLETEL